MRNAHIVLTALTLLVTSLSATGCAGTRTSHTAMAGLFPPLAPACEKLAQNLVRDPDPQRPRHLPERNLAHLASFSGVPHYLRRPGLW